MVIVAVVVISYFASPMITQMMHESVIAHFEFLVAFMIRKVSGQVNKKLIL